MSGSRDDDYRDTDGPEGGRSDEEAIRKAKSVVFVPAVGLIGLGALTIILALLSLVQLPAVGAQFDEVIKQIENDPNMPAADKKKWVDIFTKVRDFITTYGPVVYGVEALLGAIILVGGVRYLSLNNPALVVIASIGAILPFNACCLLGLVFGIWALVALANPTVKAGYAARRRGGYFPDSPQDDMR
jgi:hypothetical protein